MGKCWKAQSSGPFSLLPLWHFFLALANYHTAPLWSVKGIFLISLSSVHSAGLMNGGLHYQSLPPTLTTRLRASIHKPHISGASNEMDTVLLWVGSLLPERKTLLGDFFLKGGYFWVSCWELAPPSVWEDGRRRGKKEWARFVFSPTCREKQDVVHGSTQGLETIMSNLLPDHLLHIFQKWVLDNVILLVVVVYHSTLQNNKDTCLLCRISQNILFQGVELSNIVLSVSLFHTC